MARSRLVKAIWAGARGSNHGACLSPDSVKVLARLQVTLAATAHAQETDLRITVPAAAAVHRQHRLLQHVLEHARPLRHQVDRDRRPFPGEQGPQRLVIQAG